MLGNRHSTSPTASIDSAEDPSSVPLPPSPTLRTTALPDQGNDEEDLEAEKKLFLRQQILLDKALARHQRSLWQRWFYFFKRLLGFLFPMPAEPGPKAEEDEEDEKPSIKTTKLFYTTDIKPNLRAHPKNSKAPHMVPKTLVLDLDETLVHSTSRPYAGKGAGLKMRVVEVVLEGRSTVYTVYKRPWVDYFLRKVRPIPIPRTKAKLTCPAQVSKWYTVVIFTASLPEYADPVIDWLDGGDGGGGIIGGRLFRSDCHHQNGAYMKDLSIISKDLSHVCLVDNSPTSYAINQANGIPIEGWINDPNDECLLDLLPVLDSLRFTNDVRRVLGMRGWSARNIANS